MENTQPLVEMGEIQHEIPTMRVGGTTIDHYTLNWVSPAVNQKLYSDGTLPTQEISIAESSVEMSISSATTPLSLSLLVFDGSLTSVDPMSEPKYSFDCLAQDQRGVVVMKSRSLQLFIESIELPQNYVISIFAEYYRNSTFDTQTGSTNLVGWVFGVTKT